jgi:hypothetical protein
MERKMEKERIDGSKKGRIQPCPVLVILFWPSCFTCLSKFTSPSCSARHVCPVLVILVLFIMSCLGCPVPGFLSWLSCPGFPVLAVPPRLSSSGCPCPGYPVLGSCPKCPVPDVLPWLSCSGCPLPTVFSGRPVLVVLFHQSCSATVLAFLF